MDEVRPDGTELKDTGYEIFIGILSVLSIVNLVLLSAIDDTNLDTVLLAMNALISAIFLGDFTYRLFTANSKSAYFLRQYGWADLLASLPFAQAKVLRVFRLVRVFRLLRANGATRIVQIGILGTSAWKRSSASRSQSLRLRRAAATADSL